MEITQNLLVKTGNEKRLSLIVLGIILVLSGYFLDIYQYVFNLSDQEFYKYHYMIKDIKFFGAMLLAAASCSYRFIKTKVITFLLAVWSFILIFINANDIGSNASICIAISAKFIFVIWFIRILFMTKIESKQPRSTEAFYFFQPINSFWGIVQAIFLPWYQPRYETRVISDGRFVWSVNHKHFTKSPIEETNIDQIKGVKVPIGRNLFESERNKLDELVGKRAIFGYRDCRKLLVAKGM